MNPTATSSAQMDNPRQCYVKNGVGYVPLTRGKRAKVDISDLPLVSGNLWSAYLCNGNYYAACGKQKNGKSRSVTMHSLLLGNRAGFEIDHKNRDTLDNRRCNLRHATRSQNKANRAKIPGSKSPYKGVVWHNRDKVWAATICKNYKRYTLGYSRNQKDCAIMYNVAAQLLHGEFAVLNNV